LEQVGWLHLHLRPVRPQPLRGLMSDVSCERCGYPADSFACKVRHLAINTGDAKAAND